MAAFLDQHAALLVSMVLAGSLGLSLYLPLMTGQLSLASPGFYALGGYVAAVLSTRVFPGDGPAYPLGGVAVEMAVAVGLSAGLALLVGLCALRLRGIYLALATIAFVEVLRVLSLNLSVTGKAVGIFKIPQPFPTQLGYLWLAVPLLVTAALFTWRLQVSRTGRAYAAIREDELVAAAVGIGLTRYKVQAFVLGAVLAGLAGVVAAHSLNTWNPRQGTFDASVAVLAFTLIGGSRTVAGPIVGAFLLTALPEALRQAAGLGGLPSWLADFLLNGRLIVYGLVLVACTVFFPRGLITPGLLRALRRSTP